MSKVDALLQDVVSICNRHGIESQQVIGVFGDIDFLTEVVKGLENTENM